MHHVLEIEAQGIADATAKPPYLYELDPDAARKVLVEAGVRTTCVRFNNAIHDFMMLNPLRSSAATTGAVQQAIDVLRHVLHAG